MKQKICMAIFVFSLTCLWSICAEAVSIDFNSLSNGEIVDDQFLVSHGVEISAVNTGGGPDMAIIFDSLESSTADTDLEGPSWGGGNLPSNTVLGNLLIIAENSVDSNGDGLIDSPDDEGSRPAGSIFFDFDTPVISFGFDLIDVEGPDEYGVDSGFLATFFDDTTTELITVGFGSLVARDGAAFGNNSINRINPFTIAELGISPFSRVEINMGGSGAVDNINWEQVSGSSSVTSVPEPTTLALLGIGLAGLGGGYLRRRFRGKAKS